MRFRWKLQRLLDVTAQRELALRAKLFELSRRMARLRQQIVARRAVHRMLLSELGQKRLAERVGQQQVFMSWLPTEQRAIGRIQADLDGLQRRRGETTRELLKTKSRRETLEKLQADARQRFMKEQSRLAQRELDDIATIGFARRGLVAEPDAKR